MFESLLHIFIKDCDQVKESHVREKYGILSGAMGIVLNLLLSMGKLTAGVMTASVSVTADAFNNLSDAASSLATLIGFKMAARKADARHPFGHGRMEYLAGLGISVAILVVGLELGRSAVLKIIHPEVMVFSWLSVGILAASILVKLWMFAFNRFLGRRIDSAAILATSADALSDCVATGAVLLGLLIYRAFQLPVDGWVGLLVAVFVLRAGWESAKDTISPLLGQSPDPDIIQEIRQTVMTHPEIGGIHDLVVHDYGPGNVMATFHAEVDVNSDIREIHDVIDNIERELWAKFSIQTTIHMDPVLTDDPLTIRAGEQMLYLAKRLDPGITLHDFRMTDGPDHINLIFDLMVPRSCPYTDYQIRSEISRMAREQDPRYVTVVHVDHPYYEEREPK